jgi:capsid protein
MAWWNINKKIETESEINPLEAQNSTYYRGNWQPIITEQFDGEKTPGEMGVIRNLLPNHDHLRARAFEAHLKSDLVKIITGKFFKYVIGSGLKLQAEPQAAVLESEGIGKEGLAKFRKIVEARFAVYGDSTRSTHSGMGDLHDRAIDAFSTAFLGGDCLCIQRIDESGNLTMEVIDGQHVKTPLLEAAMMTAVKGRGNTIKNGIETDSRGQHVSFYVLTDHADYVLGKFKRIEAKGSKTGRLLAWMVYGDKHRIDHVRGIPNITQILEKVEKLDRYTEAAVGSAEERAKIVLAIEHNKDSDGENPMIGKARQAAGMGNNAASETAGYELGQKTAATIAATTQKQTFNMPVGSQLRALASTSEFQYDSFSKAVFRYLCAAVDIPPEVAMQVYEQNYSSSRAAINSWDYIVKIYRKRFVKTFYQPFYKQWLELEVIKNKISAPGFIKALQQDNFMVVEAYCTSRFVGVNMPHIDPLKEVNAIRKMLGNDDDPLISHEQASEMLGVGDWVKNVEKWDEEEEIVPIREEPIPAVAAQPAIVQAPTTTKKKENESD